MNIKVELELIKGWFDTIKETASTRRNANGVYCSQESTLKSISVHAKDASEYIQLLLDDIE